MPQRYIDTTLFDLFKVGPGPSSSHTIGPMKAGHHFAETCAALPRDLLVRAVRFRVRLYGSLSATGTGHGTDAAVVAGLLGTAPESCPAGLLQELMDDPHTRRKRSLGDGQVSVCVDDVSHDAIIHDFPYSNTLVADLLDAEDKVLHSQEYYSVGGGFIQWKGWEPPSLGEPVHRYSNMTELRAIVKEKGLNIYEIILDNEMAITGASRPSIIYSLNQIIDHMESSVRRGLDSEKAHSRGRFFRGLVPRVRRGDGKRSVPFPRLPARRSAWWQVVRLPCSIWESSGWEGPNRPARPHFLPGRPPVSAWKTLFLLMPWPAPRPWPTIP